MRERTHLMQKVFAVAAVMLLSAGAWAQGTKSPVVNRMPVPLANAGFEAKDAKGFPEGWAAEQRTGGTAYEFAGDSKIYKEGSQSLRIRSTMSDGGGLIKQVLPAASLRGKTVELQAWIKTENVTEGGAILSLRSLGDDRLLAYNMMQSAPVTGTHDWKQYSIALKISKAATDLEIGAMLYDKGTVWFDGMVLNVVTH